MASQSESMPGGMGSPYKPLVVAIQEQAKWFPSDTYMRYAPADWETKGYRSIIWRQYLDGINKIAHWLDAHLGGPSSTYDTVAYSGPNDVRYAFLWPAMIKTGRKFMICDGRITGDGLRSLLSATECRMWLFSDDSWTLEAAGACNVATKTMAFPSLEWCLDATGTPDYPYNRTFDEAKWEDILVIHTSGTTGFPKPITLNNGFWGIVSSAAIAGRKYWPRDVNLALQHNRVELCACPPKWAAGICQWVVAPAFAHKISVSLPPDVVGLSPATLTKIVQHNPFIQGLSTAPGPLVALWWDDPRSQAVLRGLEYVLYVGAPLDQATGDALAPHTRLMPVIASTDGGLRLSLSPLDRRLWNSSLFVPDAPHRFVQREGSASAAPPAGGRRTSGNGGDLYELVFDRPADGQPSLFQGAFWNVAMFGDKNEVSEKELYEPVTDSDGSTRWVFRARTDDLLKLSWLAKFHAADIEERIARHADVKHVVVGGEGRPVPYVLVEVKDEALEGKTDEKVLDDIYEGSIVSANAEDVEEIKIPRETVALAKRDKPFKLSLKHVVLRRDVETDYKAEIEALYDAFAKTMVDEKAGSK